MNQGNESKAHVTIRDDNGNVVHNVRRTVRNIKNNGYNRTGQVRIKDRTYNVIATEWNWAGSSSNYE